MSYIITAFLVIVTFLIVFILRLTKTIKKQEVEIELLHQILCGQGEK